MEDNTSHDRKPEDIVRNWWSELTQPQEPGQPSNRGELAELRRCKNLEEVFFVPAFHRLYNRLTGTDWNQRSAVAAIAGVLAHVKQEPDKTQRFAGHLAAARKTGDGPRVSELRFQRLIAHQDRQELVPALIRILHLANDAAPVKDLAKGVYWWNDGIRRDWTFQYYDALLNRE